MRKFIHSKAYLVKISVVIALLGLSSNIRGQEPVFNVLMIAIDDLNDFTGFLGGHPQSVTPNMDRLASDGTVFTKAYCPASVCNPSRAAIMSGFRPQTSKIYGNGDKLDSSVLMQHSEMLPQWFSKHGYHTLSRGKIYHTPGTFKHTWDEWSNKAGSYGKAPKNKVKGASGNMNWAMTKANKEDTPDYLNALWAAERLKEGFEKPFFMAVGIFRPHLSWRVPKEYFDKFPKEKLILPEIFDQDLEDIPGHIKPSMDYLAIKSQGLEKDALQAYLACINYADECLGVILNALENSPYKDNTLVVLWGDHGWHLGEKLRYKKTTLWEESTRTPLIIKVPDGFEAKGLCDQPVNLIDLYPTLTDICGLTPNTNNEGQSLMPFIKGTYASTNSATYTTMKSGYSLRTNYWRYIRTKGGEELYNHQNDGLEWYNLINKQGLNQRKKTLGQLLDSLTYKPFTTNKSSFYSHPIPGLIQAEKYDWGGSGVAYRDNDPQNTGGEFRPEEGVDIEMCEDSMGGFKVNSFQKGEWLNYSIHLSEKGKYSISLRIKALEDNPKGKLELWIDGKKACQTKLKAISGNTEWKSIPLGEVHFDKVGVVEFRLISKGSDCEINYLVVEK